MVKEMPFCPTDLVSLMMDLALLASLILLDIHFWKSFEKPKIATIDLIMINVVAICAIYTTLVNNSTGLEFLAIMLAPIFAFMGSATLIIKEKSFRKR